MFSELNTIKEILKLKLPIGFVPLTLQVKVTQSPDSTISFLGDSSKTTSPILPIVVVGTKSMDEI
jgi:hypothetical protein